MVPLNKGQAEQFALLQLAGVPVCDIVPHFLGSADASDEDARQAMEEWPRQREVLEELVKLTGGTPWHELSPEERLKIALDKHYAEMAYYLWSRNYSDLGAHEKSKADDCRKALEAKIAGTAGKGNFLEMFYEEYMKKSKIPPPVAIGRA